MTKPNTPANSAPETNPTPPMTSASTIGRPATIWNPCALFSVPNDIAKNAPAKPAMPADSANTASFVSSTFTPTVTDAASLSRSATSRRPNGAAPERDDTDHRTGRTRR